MTASLGGPELKLEFGIYPAASVASTPTADGVALCYRFLRPDESWLGIMPVPFKHLAADHAVLGEALRRVIDRPGTVANFIGQQRLQVPLRYITRLFQDNPPHGLLAGSKRTGCQSSGSAGIRHTELFCAELPRVQCCPLGCGWRALRHFRHTADSAAASTNVQIAAGCGLLATGWTCGRFR